VIRWLRRIVGLGLLVLAVRWGLESLGIRVWMPLDATGYPNEWGVRTKPLSPPETAAAIAREQTIGGLTTGA